MYFTKLEVKQHMLFNRNGPDQHVEAVDKLLKSVKLLQKVSGCDCIHVAIPTNRQKRSVTTESLSHFSFLLTHNLLASNYCNILNKLPNCHKNVFGRLTWALYATWLSSSPRALRMTPREATSSACTSTRLFFTIKSYCRGTALYINQHYSFRKPRVDDRDITEDKTRHDHNQVLFFSSQKRWGQWVHAYHCQWNKHWGKNIIYSSWKQFNDFIKLFIFFSLLRKRWFSWLLEMRRGLVCFYWPDLANKWPRWDRGMRHPQFFY